MSRPTGGVSSEPDHGDSVRRDPAVESRTKAPCLSTLS